MQHSTCLTERFETFEQTPFNKIQCHTRFHIIEIYVGRFEILVSRISARNRRNSIEVRRIVGNI